MTALAEIHPTLLDFTKHLDPNLKVGEVAEILEKTEDIIEFLPSMEGNLLTGHRSIVRTGYPTPTWKKLYGGVQPTKGTVIPVTDTCGMLRSYAEVDPDIADLGGNTVAFRAREERAHLIGMAHEYAETFWYGGNNPEEFLGMSGRFNSTTAENGIHNIIKSGSTPDTSLWILGAGQMTVHGIFPMGSTAGISREDKGKVTVESIDGAGGRCEMYRTYYKWDCGLAMPDWRYAVRIQFDISECMADLTSGPNLVDLITQGLEVIPRDKPAKMGIFCNRATHSMLRRQLVTTVKQSTLLMKDAAGNSRIDIDGIPVYRSDSLLSTETEVS